MLSTYLKLQRQCATAISALGLGLSAVVNQGGEAAVALGPSYQHLCDAGRAMSALFFDITRTRRRHIHHVCSQTLEKITKDVLPTSWLFGDNLAARYKEHLGMRSSAKGLVSFRKPPPRSQHPLGSVSMQPSTSSSNQRQSGNLKGQGAQRGGLAQQSAKPRHNFQRGRSSYNRRQPKGAQKATNPAPQGPS
uniref:Uncharacterized protein n=1 Tax=Lygus hesperus TaxID=30085 RepID=A0A146LUH5_LYGHE